MTDESDLGLFKVLALMLVCFTVLGVILAALGDWECLGASAFWWFVLGVFYIAWRFNVRSS